MRKVAERALALFGIQPVSVALLNHAYHTTFKVTGPCNARYVLHILRPEWETLSIVQRRTRVESELWWLDRLQADISLSVPAAVRTPEGDGVVTVTVVGMAEPRLCTLFHWIDGRFFREHLAPEQLEAVGRVTARLHNHSVRGQVPAWFDRPRVDRADAETEDEVVRVFTDSVSDGAADVMRRGLQRVRHAQIALGGGPDTFGLIHADIHQSNYMFQGGDVRLIDFGDCGWGHYLYDLAVTLSELEGFPRYAALRAALLAGYRSVRDLSPAHEALIDTFVLLREVQNVTWFVRARDDPSYGEKAAQVGERVRRIERLVLGTIAPCAPTHFVYPIQSD